MTALTGWDELDAAFLERHRTPLSTADLVRFWDGGQPDWPPALAPDDQVPRREVVTDAVAVLRDPTGPTMVLLVAPGGHGKSTAVRQIAADLAAEGHRVLFRQAGAALDADAIAALPDGGPWVLASDDADEVAAGVVRAVTGGRHDVHWLLAARDADWERQFPRGEPWERLGAAEWPARAVRSHTLALTDEDASRIAKAWGDAAPVLGPSLLSAVLEARRPDLARSVAALDSPQREAFLYAAVAEAVGVDGVDLRVVADLIGVDREQRTTIRTTLGQAGLATGSGEALRTRDPAQARAAVTGLDDDNELGHLLTALVRGTAEAARHTRPLVSDGAIVTGSPTLAARLIALGIDPQRAHQIACATADAAAEVLDNLLMTALFRARTYRAAGETDQAAAILHAAVAAAATTDDWAETARSFICELSVDAEPPEKAIVIAGVSLADLRGLGPISMVEARPPLLRIGQAADTDPRLLRAVGWLGRRVTPNFDPAKTEFRRFAALADEADVPECTPEEAVQWLGEGIAAAFAAIDDPDVLDLLSVVLPDGSLGFMQLLRTAARGQEPR